MTKQNVLCFRVCSQEFFYFLYIGDYLILNLNTTSHCFGSPLVLLGKLVKGFGLVGKVLTEEYNNYYILLLLRGAP